MSEGIEFAFLQDNARNEDAEYIRNNFIPSDNFWSLFSSKHHVIYGSRGSGKTILSKMASFPFVSKFEHSENFELLEHIGVFVNTDLRFVGSLRNKKWSSQDEEGMYFIWKFNINCMKSLFSTIDSILDYYFKDTEERFILERKFVRTITEIHFNEYINVRLADLSKTFSDYEYKQRVEINRSFLKGQQSLSNLDDGFSTELFDPVIHAIGVMEALFPKLTESSWFFCIDEAEFLTESQHLILNSFMRVNSGKIFLKMATLPFHHHTLETNIGPHLQPDDDFEYLYLDANPIYELNNKTKWIYQFGRLLFKNRINSYFEDKTPEIADAKINILNDLNLVLGESLLEKRRNLPQNTEEVIAYLSEYLSEEALVRANRLKDDRKKFGNEVWRKVSGVISLIEDKRASSGRSTMNTYSGADIIIRCTDGVPRRMINLFQEIARQVEKISHNSAEVSIKKNHAILTLKSQTRILKSFSEKRFTSSLAVPIYGRELNKFIYELGSYFNHKLHNEKISTDIVGSFRVDSRTNESLWALVRQGVAHGYLFPNISDREPTRQIVKKGSFRLGYALAPKFDLFPRKGDAKTLQNILRAKRRNEELPHTKKTISKQKEFNF